jgi:DNA-binding SARP family transcriptional activator
MDTSRSHRLTLLGGALLASADGTPLAGRAAQRHRLALLASLARAPDVTVRRDLLMARLWPESDVEQARNLLKVSVYVLRRALGEAAVVSVGESLRLSLDVVAVDTHEFETAVARGEHERAVELYRGPFLEGFFLKNAPDFDHWIDRERDQLSTAYAAALESLAGAAASRGDSAAAARWWKARAAHDPHDSRVALCLMEALAEAGNRAGALQHASVHARLLEDELGVAASADVQALAERLRAERQEGPAPDLAETTGPVGASPAPPALRHGADDATGVAGDVRRQRRSGLLPGAAVAAAVALALFGPWTREPRAYQDATAEDIARAVLRAMETAPSGLTQAEAGSLPTANVTAWELYRRASQPEVLRSDPGASEALGWARRASELDPSFAGAHAATARLYLRVGPPENPEMPRKERFRAAAAHAARAVALSPSLAEAHGTLGLADMFLYQFSGAEEHLRRAIELEPEASLARQWLVQFYVGMGRFEEALVEARRALELDPLSASAMAELGRALMVNGRCEEALGALEPLADLQPPLLRAADIAAQCHAQEGMWAAALEYVLPMQLPGAAQRTKASGAYFLARAGRRDESIALLDEMLDTHRLTQEDAFWIAMVYAGLGDVDEAFRWLDRAVDDYSITYEIREPRFAELRRDPRMGDLLARLGLR